MNVVLFDGVCGLCDASVRWLIDVDRRRVLHYAPIQGETGTAVLSRHSEADQNMSTVIYVRALGGDGERLYQRSDAAFEILHDLGGGWRILSWGRIIPRFLRDAVYRLISKHRYRWFGKLDACRVPSADDAQLFLS